MSKINNNKFLTVAIEQIPRLLGQLNRNPSSRSYGSFDRAYWHYRTNDISCCRYQEAVYTLALLYCSDFEENKYYKDGQILKWIRVSLSFTASIQRKNGSFDEWYINEGSYVGTAFLTAALSQTILLLRENNITLEDEKMVCSVIEKSARFLISGEEKTVMNQVSGAVFAVAAAGKVCGLGDLKVSADKILDKFLSKQNSEGWWSEYGGPDIGYLTLTISYLEKYRDLTNSDKVVNPINKAKEFVETFINPDNTAGGEYMSRNTEYIIPSKTLPYLGAVQPSHLDDRYLCYILYNWIEVGLETIPQDIKCPIYEKYFPESGLLRVADESFYLVANGKKGGSFRIYSGKFVYYDSGIEIKNSIGVLSTGILDDANKVDFKKGSLKIKGNAKFLKEPLLETKTMILFKAWQMFFGRLRGIQSRLKNFLRSRMINYTDVSDISFEREIKYSSGSVVVTDILRGIKKDNKILYGIKASYTAVPSSKYVANPELESNIFSPNIDIKNDSGVYEITRTFHINN